MLRLPILKSDHGLAQPETDARTLCRAIARHLGVHPEDSEVLRFSDHDRALYSTDASLYQVRPLGVIIPRSIDEAAAAVSACAELGVAVLPRGGGTSLAGQCTNEAVIIDLTPRCRAVRWVDHEKHLCEVEPGVSVDELNEILGKAAASPGTQKRLFFAPDPATARQAAIGGCIGNNAAGARSVRYGRTSENVHQIEVALSTGERLWLGPGAGRASKTAARLAEGIAAVVRGHANLIRDRFPKTIRRNAGYGLDMVLNQIEAGATPQDLDLTGLLCGSEGTLAMTLGARLKLHQVPRFKGLAVAAFESVEDAIAAVPAILAATPAPAAVELLDDVVLEAAMGNIVCRRYVEMLPRVQSGRPPRAALYVEYFGMNGVEEVRSGFDALRRILPRAPLHEHLDQGTMLRAWALRKAGEPLLHGMPGKRKPVTFVEDNAVPVENLGRFVAELKEINARHGTRAAYWAHASVGVLHVRPMLDLHETADRDRLRAIAVEVADLARACGGIMSGEHGDGRIRGPLLGRFFGAELIEAFKQVKAIFDPLGIFNPGIIIDAGPVSSLTERLRLKPESREVRVPRDVRMYFDYTDQHGFDGAVEMCNGAGVCRKRQGGTMCPSFMATLDERHSTRGRANALRLAITGQFPSARNLPDELRDRPNWDDPETIRTLDLCLSCKACKSECPSNVDVARLKAEYTAQRFDQRGHASASALFFGHVRTLNRLGSAFPSAANALMRNGPIRALLNRMLGLAPQRTLPRFGPSFAKWFKTRQQSFSGSTGQRIVLFGDCFSLYNEPEIGKAAVVLLERLGYSVEVFSGGCCGRPMISNGLLASATQTIDATLARLLPIALDPRVRAVIALEPSCLSAIKDDWLQLRLATPIHSRRLLAEKAMMAEELVARYWEMHPRRVQIQQPAAGLPVLLHGHCHQKSLWGVESSAAALRLIFGANLTILDSTCCGLAGSFGFTQERYALSMKIGELSLLPAVREMSADGAIAASGTSCRHQILDGTGKHAVHPVQLMERHIVSTDAGLAAHQ